jgi:hypothetical protein
MVHTAPHNLVTSPVKSTPLQKSLADIAISHSSAIRACMPLCAPHKEWQGDADGERAERENDGDTSTQRLPGLGSAGLAPALYRRLAGGAGR